MAESGFGRGKEKTAMLVLFKGDDTGGVFGRRLLFKIEVGEGIDLTGCSAEFVFDGITKKLAAPLVAGEFREIFYSHNETAAMNLGVRYASFRVIDAAGKVRTFSNRTQVKVTTRVEDAYPGSDTATITIGSGISWQAIEGKPDFSDIEPLGVEFTDNQVREKMNTIIARLKGTTAAILAAFCWTAFGGLTVQKSPKGEVLNTTEIVTNVTLEGGTTARHLPAYLHEARFADSYPDAAAWYYQFADICGACSSVRDGNDYARNFDLTYDERAEFVVLMEAGAGRLASVGVANVGTNISEAIATSGEPLPSSFYKALPGATVDGINSEGVVCSINLVPTNGAPWETKGGRDLNALGVVRFVLDTATSASNAAAAVASRCYIPDALKRKGYSAHFMLADERETWIVEDGTAHPATGRAVLTNYRLFADNDPYGTGYERFNIIAAGGNITSAWFRAAYRRPFSRPTEFAAPGVGTHSETDALLAWAEANVPQGAPESLTRNGRSWQTVHASRFDISNRVMRVAVQERPDWYTFAVMKSGTDEAAVRRIAENVASVKLDAENPKAVGDIKLYDEDGREKLVISNDGSFIYTNSEGVKSRIYIPLGRMYEDIALKGDLENKADKLPYAQNGNIASLQYGNIKDSGIPTNKINEIDAKADETRAVVVTLAGQINGSNVVFVVTNYISGAYVLDAAKLQIRELRDGSYRTIYNSRDEIRLHLADFETNKLNVTRETLREEIAAVLESMQRDAWGRRTSTGNPAPSNTIYTTEPSFVFGGGLEYERIAVGAGAIGILADKGAPSYTAGDSGTFLFKDATGENYFGYSMTQGYAIGVKTDDIEISGQRVTLTYNIVGSCPIIMWCPALFPGCNKDITGPGWYQLNDEEGNPIEGAPFECAVDMESTPEVATVYIDTGANPTGFFSAWTSVPGKSSFKTNMPVDLDAANGGGVVSSDGHTVIVPQPDGTWRPSNAN